MDILLLAKDKDESDKPMKNPSILTIGIFTLAFAGCVTHHPQTAEEFRKAVPGAFMAKVESFEVDRPFDDVARTFQKKAPECLNLRVRTTSQTHMSYQVIVTRFKPTVLVAEKKVELHVQQHHETGVLNVTKEPEGGYYLLVADAYPLGNDRTQIDMYRPSMGYGVLIQAIKGWATGENVGCPDMTKN